MHAYLIVPHHNASRSGRGYGYLNFIPLQFSYWF